MKSGMKTLTVALAQILGTGVAMTVATAPALAQQAQKIEKIEVTGSNIKRIEGESALPVTVISREDISRTGATTAEELLKTVSAAGPGGYSLANGIGESGRPGTATVSLRGLGDTNTLILLNGRRLANYAFSITGGSTNLNQIPVSAIERVEVLKDGASAIYGTDAIGGVINFILRKDFTGIELTAYGTKTEHGGGNQRRYSALLGFGDLNKQRFNVIVNLDYQKDDPLKASERLSFTGTGIRPDMGFAQTSSRTAPANFTFNGTSYNTSAATGCVPALGSFHVDGSGNNAPSRLNCIQDFSAVLDIYPPSERKGIFTRGTFQLASDHQLFAEYHLQKNKITYAISETPMVPDGGGNWFYPANGRFYPTSFVAANGLTINPTGPLSAAWRMKATGRRTERVDTEEQRLVAGAQGSIIGWDYNAAYAHSESKASDTYVDGYVNAALLRPIFNSGNINIFSSTPLPQDQVDLLAPTKILQKIREAKTKVDSFDGKVSKELWETRNGPLALAVGAEHRKEKLTDDVDPIFSSGNILGGGGSFQNQDAKRDVTGVFAELNIPLMRNLETQLAARYDKYSDFGSTLNPKIAMRWTPTKTILVRGSYSTGFRAPTLSDLFYPQFQGNTSGSHNDPVRCPGGNAIGLFVDTPNECDIQFNNISGGNRNITPEKSRQWTLGVIFEPTPASSVGADFWSIRRRNSIQTIGDGTIFDSYGAVDPVGALGYFNRFARDAAGHCLSDIAGSPATPANIPCAIQTVNQFQQNLGKYNTSGIDFSGTLRFPSSGFGQLSLRAEGTYVLQYRYQVAIDGPYIDNNGIFTTDNGAVSRWRHYASLNWRNGPFTASVAQSFTLGYADDTTNGNPPRRVASYETWDLQGGWDGWKGLSLVLGIRNVLDRDPPASANSQNFQVGYDAKYTDPRGRTYYATLKYLFK